jgi:thiamine biosynthesis lipoprotein
VAVAGDIAAMGGNWRIPVEHFGRVVERMILNNAAVSTSGDTEQFAEIAGQRYSHIIDPRTGQALSSAPAVSVIAPDGMEADALATAVSVGGLATMRGHDQARAIVTQPAGSPGRG